MRQLIAPVIRSRRQPRLGPPGVVLVLAVLLVGLLLVMGTSLINLASSDYQVASNESRSVQALFNADAGIEEAKMRLSPNAPGGFYDATTNPTGKRIPVGTTSTWRAYIYSGSIANPTVAQMQSAIQALDPTYGKQLWGDTSLSESTSNYAFYNTVQTGSNAIPWGWLRITLKVNSSGNPIYQNTLSGQGAGVLVATETTASTGTDSYGNSVTNYPIIIATAEGVQGSVRRMIAMEFLPEAPTTHSVTYTNTTLVTDPFSNAAHARGDVPTPGTVIALIGNMYTDSYDSRNGAYGGTNVHTRGDISTDVTYNSAIDLGPNTSVSGNAAVGPGGDPTTGITGSGTITGSRTTETAAWNIPLSTIPTGVTNSGALSLSGSSTRSLPAGTYWFSSISIGGSAQLITTGAVKIYVTGSVDIGGNGIVTAENKPPNFLLYGTRDPTSTNPACVSTNCCTSIHIHGNGNFYGAVYAPYATITQDGNGEVFGALTANVVTINGSIHGGIHYDEALGQLGETTTTTTTSSTSTSVTLVRYNRYSWREIAF